MYIQFTTAFLYHVVLVVAKPTKAFPQGKAVILGSAINQDGRSSGLTAPNGPSQTSLISLVISISDIAPSSLSFVALHGTGTPLGDPIEISALGVALTHSNDQSPRPFTTGSVKACYGHTEGAAGVTGISHNHVFECSNSKALNVRYNSFSHCAILSHN